MNRVMLKQVTLLDNSIENGLTEVQELVQLFIEQCWQINNF